MRNWGWIRVQGGDSAEIPIAQEAQALWPVLAAQLDTDIGLPRGGGVHFVKDAREMATVEAWQAGVAPHRVSTQMADAASTARLFAEAARRWPGAM